MIKPVAAIALALFSLGATAAEHQIKMLNNGKDGMMSFEPSFVKAEKGDTIKFVKVDASHNSTSAVLPAGATAWKGKMDEEIIVPLTQEGVYVYVCDPHKTMGMAGVIQVGKPVNLDAAKAEADKMSKSFVMNKDRLTKALAQVK